jgi:hypothetical protein
MTFRFDGTVCPHCRGPLLDDYLWMSPDGRAFEIDYFCPACRTYYWGRYDGVPDPAGDEPARLLDWGDAFSTVAMTSIQEEP